MKQLHINWQDGMKVNQEHFLGMENAVRNELLDHTAYRLSSYNYGLIPTKVGGSSWDLFFKLDQSNDIVLNLLACQAITPGGAYVEISPEQQHLAEYRISRNQIIERLQTNRDEAVYVVLNLDVYHKKAYGEVLPGETPARQPYSVPSVYLSIAGFPEVSHFSNNGISQLIVGRIIYANNQLKLDETYIPPCTSVNANPRLLAHVEEWTRGLEGALFNNLKNTLIQAENAEKDDKQAVTFLDGGKKIFLSGIVRALTTALLEGVAAAAPMFPILKEQPFMLFVATLKGLAWKMKVAYICLSTLEQNQLLNYFAESMGIRNMVALLDTTIAFQYEHDRIDLAISTCQEFLYFLHKLYHAEQGLPRKTFTWKVDGDVIIITDQTISPPKDFNTLGR